VEARSIELLVSEAELESRRQALGGKPAPGAAPTPDRGYAALFHRTVLQADEGCDFDFLVPPKPAA
jgi:dihydroxy-acid dehydratase